MNRAPLPSVLIMACWLGSPLVSPWCLAEEVPWTVAHGDPRSSLISSEPFPATVHHAGGQHFQLSPWPNSWSHLIFPVAQAPVIAENSPAVRIKANRSDIQLAVRVVLPRTVKSESGIPLTIVLEGDTYEMPNEWVLLRLRDLPRAVERQVRVLRARLGEIDAREAYIDLVSLKVFGNDEAADLWLCAPNLPHADLDHSADLPPAGQLHKSPQRACQKGDLLHVDGRHFVPRVIRSNGEAWDFLKGLGFNTIAMDVPPTLGDAARAEQLELWLVTPPPPPSISPNARPFERVIAWDLGMDSSEGASVHAQIDRLRDAEETMKRPILCYRESRGRLVVRQADILLQRRWPLATSLELDEYVAWLSRGSQSHLGGQWVAIQTDLPEVVVSQAAAFGARRDRIVPQPQQIELLAAIGAAQGARGFWFDSRTRLDSPNHGARVRNAALKMTNARLRQIEPWTTCGELVGPARCNRPNYHASLLRLERASLLIVKYLPRGGQRSLKPVHSGVLEVTVAGVAAASEAWVLNDEAPQRVPLQRVAGGARLLLEVTRHVQYVVLTRDAMVMQKLGRESLDPRSRLRQAKRRLAALKYGEHVDSAAVEPISVIDPHLSWPPAAHCSASASLAHRNPPSAGAGAVNLLPEGGFEGPGTLSMSGWQIGCLPDTDATAQLSPSSARSGLQGLKLVCPPAQTNLPLASANTARVWVVTPPLQLSPGQTVRIEGFVCVPQPLTPNRLVIADNLGGRELSVGIQKTEGWAKFTLLRAATDIDPLCVSFSLTGPGTVFLDDLRIIPISAAR